MTHSIYEKLSKIGPLKKQRNLRGFGPKFNESQEIFEYLKIKFKTPIELKLYGRIRSM
jgi:hypothetical protein